MASLTPLSKGLIGLAVLGGMASAVWNLALKERWAAKSEAAVPASVAAPATVAVPATATAPPATPQPAPAAVPTAAAVPVAPAPTVATPVPKTSAADNSEKGRQLMEAGNFVQARAHLEQALKDGDGAAACHLGEMTLKGQGGIKANQEQSAKLFQTAQSRGVICFASGK